MSSKPADMGGAKRPFNRFVQHGILWRRIAVVIAVCVAFAAIASSEVLHEALLGVLAAVEEIIMRHPFAGASLFVAFAAVSAMFTFVSVAIIMPAAVFVWGEPASMLLLWGGWMLGGIATYGAGKFLGRRVVRWLTDNQTLHRFEHRVQRNAPFWLVLLLQLALPSEIPGYILGIVRYPFLRYLLALGVAELPYTVATVYLGASFVERSGIVILGAGLAIAVLSGVAFYLLRRVMRMENDGRTK